MNTQTAVVDADMARILERLRAAPPVDYETMALAEARAVFDAGAAAWVEPRLAMAAVEERTAPGAAGPLRARLLRPRPGPLPLVVYVHGGGWTFGSIDTHDCEMRALAAASGAAVLGFDYRLAPEHPFPAPLDDVLAVVAFAEAGGLGDGIDATRLALAGDSAGANLALAALLARRDAGLAPLRSAALFYGCFAPDLDTASHRRFGDGSFVLSTARMGWYWRNFLGAEPLSTRSLAAPSRADLRGLPPLYLDAAGLDPLLDDALDLGRRLAHAGVAHRLDVVPGVVHGFRRMTRELPAARDAAAASGAFLAHHFDRTI